MLAVAPVDTATPRLAGFIPQRKQYIALTCPADDIFFGGAVGPGKTTWGLNSIGIYALEHPGSHQLILRRKTKELRKLIREFRRWFPEHVASLNQNRMEFTFYRTPHPEHGPALVTFGHLFRDENIADYYGDEYERIYWDEATHFTHFMRQEMRIRLRSPLEDARTQMLYTSNPGNVGHYDFKREYVAPPDRDVELLFYFDPLVNDGVILGEEPMQGAWRAFPPGARGRPAPYVVWRPERTPEHDAINAVREGLGLEPVEVPTRCYIPGTIQDNKYLFRDPAYLAQLLTLPRKRRLAMLRGDWDAIEGQFFEDFNPSVHVIPYAYNPKRGATCWRSIDWGHRAPLCVHWHTFDQDLRMTITYRELYVTRLSDREVCRTIQELTPKTERVYRTYADPSMWIADSRDEVQSHAEAYEEYGVPLEKANNARRAGWAKCREGLALDPYTERPHWAVSSNCRNLIRVLPTAVASELDPDDIDQDCEDHPLDCWRYGMTAEPSYTQRRGRGIVVASGFGILPEKPQSLVAYSR